MKIARFKYSDGIIPDGYSCKECDIKKVRLYRLYHAFLDDQILRCRKCALKNQSKEEPDNKSEHSIGWLVAAVPLEDGSTYWGYSSVPEDGVNWWNNLKSE